MNDGLWARVERVLDLVLEQERSEWPRAVEAACAGDPQVRREVETLLARYTLAERAFKTAPSGIAAALVAEALAQHRGIDVSGGQMASLAAALGDRYAFERELGRGGMATVFLAHDRKHHRDVAIKVLRPEVARVLGADHFLREIEIAARLAHPHIVPLYDSGRAGDSLYYVMPYLDGDTLRGRLQREKQLPFDDALRITREIADALSYAHDRGIVHRDVKPENVLFEAGHAVVSDFGIARAVTVAGGERLTASGILLGTPAYMSPEQATGHVEVDARSDVYALGCVLYEMLAGDPPFTGATPQAILARKSVGVVPELSVVRDLVPPGVERAIRRALAKAPADRFATANELIAALGDRSAAPRRARRVRAAWVAGGAGALALAGFALVLVKPRDEPVPQSVAVLYFDNLSPDTSDAYLADGLTEEIASRLGDVGRLQVKSRNAVRQYRGAAVSDLSAAAGTLGVSYLVEGSVRRAGDRVRASIHLVDARTGFRVWGDDYDRATSDILALQEDIAREVAVQIAGRLLPAEQAALTVRPTEHPEAYDHFLRGNYYLTQRTPGAVARAIAEHETAVRLDSGFTDALARTAYGYALYLDWGWAFPGLPPDSLLARGSAAAEAALTRDSTAADAWMAHAYMLLHRHPRTLIGVGSAFERALSIDSSNAEAWHQYGWVLYLTGDDTGAVAAYHRALDVEPERPFTLVLVAAVPFYEHRFAEAVRWLDSALMVDPSFSFAYAIRALAKLHLDDERGALADARSTRVHAEDPVYAETAFAIVQAGLGDTTSARALAEPWAAGVLARATVPVEEAVFVAAALAATGDHERALQALERARPRGAHLFSDMHSADLDPLRADLRFQRLLAEARPPGHAR